MCCVYMCVCPYVRAIYISHMKYKVYISPFIINPTNHIKSC